MIFRTLTNEELLRYSLHQAKTDLEKELSLRLLEFIDSYKARPENNPQQMEFNFGDHA